MVDVYAAEHVAEPRQLRQSAVSNGPVRKQTREFWEDAESVSAHACVGIEERRNHHVGAILVHSAVSWVVWRAVGVGCAGVLRFHTVAVSVERVYKLVECGAVIAVRGVAHALECRAERYRRHRERTALRCR